MPPSTHKNRKEVKERIEQMHDSITAGDYSVCCPFCEGYELEPFGYNAALCPSCGSQIGGALLETLYQLSELSAVAGEPACECGQPEMRCLPEGVYWVYCCLSCGSEVLPLSRPPGVQKIPHSAYTHSSQSLS